MPLSQKDKQILRTLAGHVREIAELPEQEKRRAQWYRHNALKGDRPMILCFPEGAWSELVPESVLECADPKLREWENLLRQKIYWWEHIHDDNTLDPCFDIEWAISKDTYGVDIPTAHGENRGSYTWEPPLKELPKDMEKLSRSKLSVDHETTQAHMELAGEIFGDLLAPRMRCRAYWTMGLTWEAIKLVGLENFMMLMVTRPDQVHALMAWLRDEHLQFLEWLEKQALLTMNNRGNIIGTGGVGYTDELPQTEYDAAGPVRLKNIWGFSESQETVGISPDMFGEFIFPYQLPLLEKFGLNYYGCCEGLESRMQYVCKIPNLRRVSVAPWADQETMAQQINGKYVFARKPNPAEVCVRFDEHDIRRDIRTTLEIAGQSPIEIILKDTHTIQNQPWRITRWVEIALEEVDRYLSGDA